VNANSKKYDGPWRRPAKTTPSHKRIEEDKKRKRAIELKMKAVNYEENAPRCDDCKSFRKAGVVLIDSLPVKSGPKCLRHGFKCKSSGCCDSWMGRNGDYLEAV